MREYSNLGKWIREKFQTQAVFGEKIGVRQGRVSKWVLGQEGISPEYQKAIRKLGYTGPWPAEEAQDAAAGGPASYVTREEFAELRGALGARIDGLERALERMGEIVRDLVRESEQSRPPGRT